MTDRGRQSRQLLCCRSNEFLLRRAAAFLQSIPANVEVLVLAPSRGAADDLARGAGLARLGLHRTTPRLLAAQLAAPALGAANLAPASALGIEALAARVTDACLDAGELHYFHPVADLPGFARALASTLTELRLEEVEPKRLASSGAPGADLALLLAGYTAQLAEHGLADLALILRLAAEAVPAAPRWAGLPLLLLDTPPASSAHSRLLAALIEQAPSVFAAVLGGDEEGLARLKPLLGIEIETDVEPAGTSLARVRRHLFSPTSPEHQALDASLELFSTPGEGLECVEIARRILQLARDGTAFDRMAILLRNPDRYQPLVEEALRRAGLPGYFTRGTARPDAAGRAFLALLACAQEGCSASRFAEYLSLGQAPPVTDEGAPRRQERGWVPPEDEVLSGFGAAPAPALHPASGGEPETSWRLSAPLRWERLLVDAAVVGGRDRWSRRLRGLEAEFRLQLGALSSEDESHRLAIERRIEQLGHLQRFALPLIELLDSLPRRALWREWIERLTELAETALRSPDSVLALLNELWPMNEVGPVGLDEVYGVLSERLRFLRIDPPPRRYGCVWIGSIEEARGRHFDVVFLPGLAEGIFPKRVLEDPLLVDAQRATLPSNLLTRDDRVGRERMLLRIAAAAGARLVFSYPRMDGAQARPRVPSFYALELVRAAEGGLPDLREFETRAGSAAPARLGWPAPVDESEAIDDAEYDLAWLARILQLERGEAKGAGRYLVEANAPLGRSLRARWKRWRKTWSAADGLVDPDPAAREVLARHRMSERAYSPSALEQFSLCPYRFFLRAIHQLRPREESVPLEQLDPLTRGALFHAVQFELFKTLEGAALLDFSPEQLPEILDKADQALNRVANRFREELAPAIPRVWSSEIEDVRVDLRGWIRHAAQSDRDWLPHRFEFHFGLAPHGHPGEGRDPRSTPEEARVAGARLRGSVDLVERHRTQDLLRVTDHKTGRPPTLSPSFIAGGTVLQPVLYALAMEKLSGTPVASGRLSYCTQRGQYKDFTIPLNQKARELAAQAMRTIDGAIEHGFLPPAPRTGTCDTCDFRPVCGPYEETRTRRKPADRLEDLTDLRRQP